jgi:hypothetical protein
VAGRGLYRNDVGGEREVMLAAEADLAKGALSNDVKLLTIF